MKITIDLKPFKSRVTVFIGEPNTFAKQIPSALRGHLLDEGYLAKTVWNWEERGNTIFHGVICSRSHSIAVLAHEAVHIVNQLLFHLGCDPDFNNDEIQAYLVEYICSEVEKVIRPGGSSDEENRSKTRPQKNISQ